MICLIEKLFHKCQKFLLLNWLTPFCFLVGSFSAYSQGGKIIDQVVAQVGDEIILLSDIEGNLKQLRAQQKEIPANAKCSLLEKIMVQKLLVNQAKLDSIEVSDVEVENNVTQRINQILAYMNNDRNTFIEYYGKSPEEVLNDMQQNVRAMMMGDRLKTRVLENITITPTEVKAFFNSIHKDSLPFYSSEVEVSEIVVSPVANDASKARSKKKILEIVERINNGESFAEMARLFSDDSGTRADGGDLGWIQRGQYIPEFEGAAFKLVKGEVSPIVETEFGFHIIQMIENRGYQLHLRHILITPNVQDADKQKAWNLLDSVRDLILSDTLTFQEAVLLYSDDNEQSFLNGGRILNPASASSYFEVGDLDPDIYFMINSMEVGEISQPTEFMTLRNEIKYRIVKLDSKSIPHQANFKQDFTKILELAKQSKQSKFFSSWIEEKIAETHFSTDPLFEDCKNIMNWIQLKK